MSCFDPDAGWSRWPAPAKLNLFLRILGRRADGYHLLQTVFQLLDWGDDIFLRVRDDGALVRVAGPPTVDPAADLGVRAALALRAATGCQRGADIAIIKRIPMGGGFGGGSSDAASVLVGLNALWQTRLDVDALATIGLGLGADVPVLVHGHNAWAEGVGEDLRPVELPPRHYLLLDPGVAVPTGELFQAPELTRNASPITLSDFVRGVDSGNCFEPVLRARVGEVDRALTALAQFGPARLTGTGSGCFVAFDRAEQAHAARAALARDWQVWVAAGVTRSPLLDSLQVLMRAP